MKGRRWRTPNYGVGSNATLSSQLWVWSGSVENGNATGLSKVKENVQDPDAKWMSYEAIGTIRKFTDGTWEARLLSDDGGSTHGKQDSQGKFNPFANRYFWGETYRVK